MPLAIRNWIRSTRGKTLWLSDQSRHRGHWRSVEHGAAAGYHLRQPAHLSRASGKLDGRHRDEHSRGSAEVACGGGISDKRAGSRSQATGRLQPDGEGHRLRARTGRNRSVGPHVSSSHPRAGRTEQAACRRRSHASGGAHGRTARNPSRTTLSAPRQASFRDDPRSLRGSYSRQPLSGLSLPYCTQAFRGRGGP